MYSTVYTVHSVLGKHPVFDTVTACVFMSAIVYYWNVHCVARLVYVGSEQYSFVNGIVWFRCMYCMCIAVLVWVVGGGVGEVWKQVAGSIT